MTDIKVVIGLATLAWASWTCYVSSFKGRGKSAFEHFPLPPGPKGLPLVGNLFQYPANAPWEVFSKWGNDHKSDLVHVNMAGKHVIIVNTRRAAKEIFERRSAKFSTRPRFVMANELIGWSWQFCFGPNNLEWRAKRRSFQQGLHPSNLEVHEPHEVTYTQRLLRSLLHDPDNFADHIRLLAGAVTLAMAYGIPIEPIADPYLAIAEEALVGLTATTIPGMFLVETFPLLKHIPSFLPGAGFKRRAKIWGERAKGMLELPFVAAQLSVERGNPDPSYCTNSLQRLERAGVSDSEYERKVVQETAGAMFVGGSDTTVSAMVTFVMMMTIHPEIQATAQAEIDRVVGSDRLPTHGDKPNTPYLSAVIKEVLRCYPVTPFAVPHAAEVDDEYGGYHIPAGATMVGNAWAMLHNEEDYPNPLTFDPSRFLNETGELNTDAHEPLEAFGFGRRVCPAKHIAISTLWLAAACMVASFNISKKQKGGEGLEKVDIEVRYTTALISHAFPFQCEITPRSLNAVNLINRTEKTSRAP